MQSSSFSLPETEAHLQDVIQQSRSILHRRALIGAVASTVPIPGLDWAVDTALLSKLLPQINSAFGLAPEQLDQLQPHKRKQIQQAVAMVGSILIGKFVTQGMILRLAKMAGARIATKQFTKYIPLAGQAVATTLGYAALRYLGERHIKDCIQVVRSVQNLPEPLSL